MMRLSGIALALSLVAGLGVARSPSAAPQAASRIIDRTVSCTTGYANGAKVIYVGGKSGFKKGETFEWLGQVTVATGGSPLPKKRNEYRPTLAGLVAGWPPKPPITGTGLGFDAEKRCRGTRARVPLSKRALRGGLASQFGDDVICVPAGPVQIHVRGVFTEPVPLALVGKKPSRFYSAIGHMLRGQLAVRNASGKPLVYGEVLDSGAARLFTARSCT